MTALGADQFIKITAGPVVTDVEHSMVGSWFDYNNDGNLDLFVAVASGGPCSLYRNNGDGTFTKITGNSLTSSIFTDAYAAPIADYNNDGRLDLFLGRGNFTLPNLLFKNTGNGGWENMPANVFDTIGSGSSESAWVDYDRDGYVDLFNQNSYYSAVNDALFRNLGNGTFHRMTSAEVGLGDDNAMAVGCAWSDYDNDGWPDVFLAQGSDASNPIVDTSGLFRNDGQGKFSRVSGTGIQFPAGRVTFFPAWIDYDSDGMPDLFLETADQNTTQGGVLYRNLGNGSFADVTSASGIVLQQDVNGDFVAWGDYDNDGFLDALSIPFFRTTGAGILYRNQGNGTFQSVDIGSPLVDGAMHQSVTWADYNNDGFLDLFLSCNSSSYGPAPNYLYRNNGPGIGNVNHWLEVKLVGRVSNRAAIGAKVRVLTTIAGTPRSQLREMYSNYGYLSGGASPLIAHFGLGDATTVTTLRIEWPSGLVQEFADVPANQNLTIEEGRPVMMTPQVQAGGAVQFQLNGGLVGTQYVTEATGDLSAPASWTPVSTNTGPTTPVVVPAVPAADQRFLRVKQQQ